MDKEINIVDKNNNLVASISEKNIVVHNDYEVIATDDREARFRGENGYIKVIRPEEST